VTFQATIPQTLHADGLFHVPVDLANTYEQRLTALGLIEHARHPPSDGSDGPIGGQSAEETHTHFCHRFLASSLRFERILADVDATFGDVNSHLLQTFSEGTIRVLDIACGTGGSILGLLATLVELRKCRSLPTLPLTLEICGADISPIALQTYEDMLRDIKPALEGQGISIAVVTTVIDLMKFTDIVAFCNKWFDPPGRGEKFVLVGAVNGFLKSNYDSAAPSVRHIVERLSVEAGTLLWAEPRMNNAGWLGKKIYSLLSHLGWHKDEPKELVSCGYQWRCPIQIKDLRGSVALLRYERTSRYV
jgi:SAM-dependent methyltransferase